MYEPSGHDSDRGGMREGAWTEHIFSILKGGKCSSVKSTPCTSTHSNYLKLRFH